MKFYEILKWVLRLFGIWLLVAHFQNTFKVLNRTSKELDQKKNTKLVGGKKNILLIVADDLGW